MLSVFNISQTQSRWVSVSQLGARLWLLQPQGGTIAQEIVSNMSPNSSVQSRKRLWKTFHGPETTEYRSRMTRRVQLTLLWAHRNRIQKLRVEPSWTSPKHFPREKYESQRRNSALLNTPWKQNPALPDHRGPAPPSVTIGSMASLPGSAPPVSDWTEAPSIRKATRKEIPHEKKKKKKVVEWSLIGSRLFHAAAWVF